MTARLPDILLSLPHSQQYDTLPDRIFLDTNVVQCLHEFGGLIFEGEFESPDTIKAKNGKLIRRGERMFDELIALHRIFYSINNASFTFAVSDCIAAEIAQRSERSRRAALFWFEDLLDHFRIAQACGARSLEKAKELYERAQQDRHLLGAIQEKDRPIILDAIRLDCRALLTIDRFASPGTQTYFHRKYNLMIIWPSDFARMLDPFRALYNGWYLL